MAKKNLGLLIMFFIFGLLTVDAASGKLINTAGPHKSDYALMLVGPFLADGLRINQRYIKSFDDKDVRWRQGDIVSLAPGTHTIIASPGSHPDPLSQTVTVRAGSYYRLSLKAKNAGSSTPVLLESLLFLDLTDNVQHGSEMAYYTQFAKAEKKAGINTLADSVGRIRAPEKRNQLNLGVYDLSSSDLVTLEIGENIFIRKFNNEDVLWVGAQKGSLIQIPAGQHSLTMDYVHMHRRIGMGIGIGTGLPGSSGMVSGAGLFVGGVAADNIKPDITEGINLSHEFGQNGKYILKPKTVNKTVIVNITSGKGTPKNQSRGSPGVYNLAVDGKPTGRFTIEELLQIAGMGALSKGTILLGEGAPQWAERDIVDKLFGLDWDSVPFP